MLQYALIDSGNEQKFERFGKYTLVRPCSQAMWKPTLPQKKWEEADALFTREENRNHWEGKLPETWTVEIEKLLFKIAPTDFGHVGVFPEHSGLWHWIEGLIKTREQPNVLNLFAYSGGATLASARAGAKVCHLDASKGMVAWARENAALNHMTDKPIRWIIDDVVKFLQREIKRGVRYDGIILDPPSFGRGNQGEVFKIERDIIPLLELCRQVLSENPLFVVLSSHTPGMSPLVMDHLMNQMMKPYRGKIESGEMTISGPLSLPCGSYARWKCE
jgi:23S rRNA (cytosine1962-C5)-methyltransferase